MVGMRVLPSGRRSHTPRSRDPDKLSAAMNAVKEMLAGLNITRS